MLNATDKLLVNDGTKTETVTWDDLKADIDGRINSDENPPLDPSPGDIWLDTSECPPQLNRSIRLQNEKRKREVRQTLSTMINKRTTMYD